LFLNKEWFIDTSGGAYPLELILRLPPPRVLSDLDFTHKNGGIKTTILSDLIQQRDIVTFPLSGFFSSCRRKK